MMKSVCNLIEQGLYIWGYVEAFQAILILAQHIRFSLNCLIGAMVCLVSAMIAGTAAVVCGAYVPLCIIVISYMESIAIQSGLEKYHYKKYVECNSSPFVRFIVMACLIVMFTWISIRFNLYVPVCMAGICYSAWKKGKDWMLGDRKPNTSVYDGMQLRFQRNL